MRRKPRKNERGLFSKLLRYLFPYKRLLFFSFVFLFLSTILELSLPYITKIGIDLYIMPRYALVEAKNLPNEIFDYEEPILIKLAPGKYLIDLSKVKKEIKFELEKKKSISKERFILSKTAEFKDKPKFKEIVRKVGASPLKEGKYYLFPYSGLKKLKKEEISFLRGNDLRRIKILFMVFLSFILLNFFSTYSHLYLLYLLGQKVMYDMRDKIFSHLLRLPVSFFDRNPVGRLVTRTMNDVSAINEMYTAVLVYLVKDVLIFLGVFAIMFKLNPRLATYILLTIPFVLLLANLFRIKAREAYREVRRSLAKLNSFLQEHISGIGIIHLFNVEKKTGKKFEIVNRGYYLANMKQITVFAIFRPLIEVVSAVAVALLIWRGGGDVISRTLSFGSLVAFISYIEMLFSPVRDLAEKYNILQSSLAAAERIFDLLNEPGEKRKRIRAEKIRGEIVFDRVWFAYEDNQWVLKDLSFRVRPGETIAIVGPTGAGKSSIINLLLKFYKPQRGRILIDGKDIDEYDPFYLRKNMGIVMQDVFLFSTSIRENITLKSPMEEEKLVSAAKKAHAQEFIERLEKKYDTTIGERGASLSLGQKQLVSFARAIAFNPKILILDEATSSVDSYTESLIQKATKELLKERTSIVIAHRLSTIREADRILVLVDGKIVEEGNHEELMKNRAVYYNLVKIQFPEIISDG